jgi:hypothetical protein
MVQFGNVLGQIADKSILAEQSQAVSSANTTSQLGLAALASDSKLRNMSLTAALGEYKIRSKKIYDDVTAGMSPAAKRQFSRSWSTNSANAQIKFQAAAVKRNNGKIEASAIIGSDEALRLGGINGFKTESLATVVASYQNLVTNGVWGADKAAQETVKFTQLWAKEAISKWINDGTVETLSDQHKTLDEGGKMLPPMLKAYWDQLRPSTQKTLVRQTQSALESYLNKDRKATAKAVRVHKGNQDIRFGKIITNIRAAERGDQAAQKIVDTYTREHILTLARNDLLEGSHVNTITTLLFGPEKIVADAGSVSDLITKTYAVADLRPADQNEAFTTIRSKLNTLIAEKKANTQTVTTINSLIDKITQRELKGTEEYKARKQLMTVLRLGGDTGMFAIISGEDKPAARIKAVEALREFDLRMEARKNNGLPKENPFDVVDELILRAGMKPVIGSLLKPRFVPEGLAGKDLKEWHRGDVDTAGALLAAKARANMITGQLYKDQLKNLERLRQAAPEEGETNNSTNEKRKKKALEGRGGG